MKAVKEQLSKDREERVAEFEKGASAFAKKIVANFKDYEFVGFSQPFFTPLDLT
jgi:hypothetical protein